MSQPLSSVRLSGSFGISPAAKPITRKRPSQAIARSAASLMGAADRIVDDVDAVLAAQPLEAWVKSSVA